MKKALIVAKWEFITTVTRGAYIFAVIAMPLFYGGMFALAGFAGRSAATATSRAPVAIVDQAHFLDLGFSLERAAAREQARSARGNDATTAMMQRSPAGAAALSQLAPGAASLKPYDTLDAALGDLKAHRVSTVFAISADYMQTGAITQYSLDSGFFSVQSDRGRQTQVADAIRASLLKSGLSGDALARAYAPALNVARMQRTSTGDFEPATDDSGLGPIAGSFGVFLLLTMAIFFSAGFLQQATIADRQNKVIEILLSSIDPDDLVLGKLLGLGGAGLLQVFIYIALVIVPGMTLLSIFQIPMAKLALSVAFFIVGYLVFAVLMTGTGMIGRTAQESAQISMIWMLFASVPWFFVANIGASPNGPLARTLSFLPPTSAIATMMRLSSSEVAPLELAAILLVDSVAIYFIFRAAARIFRASALMYGKRPNLPELMRWIRAA